MKTQDRTSNDTLDVTFSEEELLKLIRGGERLEYSSEKSIRLDVSPKVLEFISEQRQLTKDTCVALLRTSDEFNVKHFPACDKYESGYELAVNLKPINDTRYINRLFMAFNEKLQNDGFFIGCVETYPLRKQRLLKKYWPGFNYIYYFFDYIFKRVFPKIKLLDKLYFFITAGRNRALSETETLGRLNYCGFQVQANMVDGKLMYFAATKAREVKDVEEKKYGIFLKLPRKGKNGKTINVYKLRSMFAYAEYIQDYVYRKNYLSEGGKFKNDFRISLLGRKLRRYFLDELPMLINLIKGDLKIVGVRPLSDQYFSLYGSELQQKRLRHKPGLIPPYYADMPTSLEEIQESEMKYLNAYEKAPIKTDLKYFWLAVRNIVFKKARSN